MKRILLSAILSLLALGAYASDCIPSGTTDQYTYFVAVDSTDFTTRETGLSSFTVYRSRNGGTAAAFTTPTINETSSANMPGVYELLLDEDMTIGASNTVEHFTVHITATGMAPVTKEFCISTIDADLATVDGNVDSILTDTGTTIPGTITTIDNEIAVIDANVDNLVLEQHVTTIATLASQTSFTLTAGSADADAYNGWEAIVIDSATSTQVAVGIVQDYAVTTRTVTLMVDPGVFTMAVGDTVVLRPANANVRMTNCYEQAGDGTTGTEWSGTGDGGCS